MSTQVDNEKMADLLLWHMVFSISFWGGNWWFYWVWQDQLNDTEIIKATYYYIYYYLKKKNLAETNDNVKPS